MKEKDNTLKVITHILGYFTSWLGPLIILLVSKEKDVKEHAKKALNWQISLMIYSIISVILLLLIIGFLFIFILMIINIIFCIIASIKAGEDKLWDYPLAIPFLR